MAGASGAIIVRDDGKSMQWRNKCESCGYVGSVIHQSSTPSPGSVMHAGMNRCDKCGQMTDIAIYG